MQVEVQWWNTWKDMVRNAALKGRVGYRAFESWIDVAMGLEEEKTQAEGVRG